MAKPLVIGVAGGSGSGKSTLVERLCGGPLGRHVSVLPHDAYYRDRAHAPAALRAADNWDHPDALDNALYVEHVDRLVAGAAVSRPIYDFKLRIRSPHALPVPPRPVLVLEGVLVLAIAEIRARMDLRVYVETPADLRLARRVLRDVENRGRALADVIRQYEATVRPMHALYVEPSRDQADLLAPWTNANPAVVALLEARIEQALAARPG